MCSSNTQCDDDNDGWEWGLWDDKGYDDDDDDDDDDDND